MTGTPETYLGLLVLYAVIPTAMLVLVYDYRRIWEVRVRIAVALVAITLFLLGMTILPDFKVAQRQPHQSEYTGGRNR